jgi:hypothetical protein
MAVTDNIPKQPEMIPRHKAAKLTNYVLARMPHEIDKIRRGGQAKPLADQYRSYPLIGFL